MTSEISSVTSSTLASTATSAQSTTLSRAQDAVTPAVAGQLGISTPQLQTQLESGKSLADAAQEAGVSSEKLHSAISDALQKSPHGSAPGLHSLAKRVAHHVAPWPNTTTKVPREPRRARTPRLPLSLFRRWRASGPP